MNIGTTCLKKYGITNHLKNRILIQVLKENIVSLDNYDLEERVKTWIQTKYGGFRKKINECSQIEFDYYDIVAPFRRLLTDVCELVTEYNFDLISLLREIEGDVESMNASTKHHMIDESDDSSSSISTIETDISFEEFSPERDDTGSTVSEGTAETPDVDEISSLLSFCKFSALKSEEDTDNIDETVSIVSEGTAETPNTDNIDETGSIVSAAHSEFSIEEPEQDGQKAFPIAVADAFCIDPNCDPQLHRYCEIKRRLNNLKSGFIEHRIHIHSIRTELEHILEESRNFRTQIREQRDFVENYMISRRLKSPKM